MDTPIVLVIFNRPKTTARVFEVIRQAQPRTLLVVADGPRPGRPEDRERCAAARAIIEQVDWNCTVLKNYADENLGCQQRIASGLNWVFDQVEAAIILEDDCLPHPTFFPFCEALLQCYADDERVMTISGNNFQQGLPLPEASYYFSQFMHCWGWATWRRAWWHFDVSMTDWPTLRDTGWLHRFFSSPRHQQYWTSIFNQVYQGHLDSWAYPWQYTIWRHGGLNILPDRNLVSNIGFGGESTHTRDGASPLANLPVEPMPFPLRHPSSFVQNKEADAFTQRIVHRNPSLGSRLRCKARRLMNALSL